MVFSVFSGIYADNTTQNSVNFTNITNNINNTTAIDNTIIPQNNSVIFVSNKGNNDNNGLTVKTSKRTIQNAMDTVPENGTIYIKSGTYYENLKINKNVSLIGIDTNVKIDGDFKDSCIIIKENCTVSIEKLTIQRAYNTGLINHGKTNITHVTIKDNAAEDTGGIFNTGTITIANSIITKNTANHNHGGIYNEGHLTITNSQINNNKACSFSGGICSCGDLNINNSEIKDNKAGYGYAGLHIAGTGIIQNSKITNNKANENAGGLGNYGVLTIINSQINDNICQGYDGNLVNKGSLTIINSEIMSNKINIKPHIFKGETIPGRGGGIWNSGTMKIDKCKIKKNIAWYGGGIYNEGFTNINNTLIIGNSVNSAGGGIYNDDGDMTINNSQIIGNEADEFFARNSFRIFVSESFTDSEKSGGGICSPCGFLKVDNCLIHGNCAGQKGGGIHVSGSFQIYNSIVSDNWCWNEGGGVWCGTPSWFKTCTTIVNTDIKDNTAFCKGGGIYGPVKLEFVNVYNNFALHYGGVNSDVKYDARSKIGGNLF